MEESKAKQKLRKKIKDSSGDRRNAKETREICV